MGSGARLWTEWRLYEVLRIVDCHRLPVVDELEVKHLDRSTPRGEHALPSFSSTTRTATGTSRRLGARSWATSVRHYHRLAAQAFHSRGRVPRTQRIMNKTFALDAVWELLDGVERIRS